MHGIAIRLVGFLALLAALSSHAATVVFPSQGGTGVANNNAATITRSGNHALTVTTTGATNVTLPTSGTVCASGNACSGTTITSSVAFVGPATTYLQNAGSGSIRLTVNAEDVALLGSTEWRVAGGKSFNFYSGASGVSGTCGAGFSYVSSGVLGIGAACTAGSITGGLSLTNLTTAATSSTGTAAIIDGSNILRPLTSSERFKANIRRDWTPSEKQTTAFLSIAPILFDYRDQKSEMVEVEADVANDDGSMRKEKRMEKRGEDRVGVKNVLGFSAEELNAAGLTDVINYDADGKPLSLREHALHAYTHAILKALVERVQQLEAALLK